MMRRGDKPRVDSYIVRVRAAAPQAIRLARALGAIGGRGINGQTGTIRYGYPAPGTLAKFGGYATPPQLFIGYDARKIAGGTFRGDPSRLPATNTTNNPLTNAMAVVTNAQMGNS